MLVSFSVSNYKSLKEPTHFSMVAKKAMKELPENLIALPKNKHLLRSALVYGANASGKTNLIEAMGLVAEIISQNTENQKVGHVFHPFRLSTETETKNVAVSYVFLAQNQIEFRYELEFSATAVVRESLHFRPKGQEALLYERSLSTIKFGEAFRGGRQIFEEYVVRSENAERLLLVIAGQLGLEWIRDAYQFFQTFYVWDQTQMEMKHDWLKAIVFKSKSTLWFEFYKKLIMALDFGIKNLDVVERKNEFGEKAQYDFWTTRRKDSSHPEYQEVAFSFFEESAGTQSLTSVIIPILDALLWGRPAMIDEIDRSLHPHLVEYLIRLFHDPEINKKNAQLICTSHNPQLMNPTFMRRDQIWITEKDENGASTLFPISQFGDLDKKMPFGKYYLAGKLGGTPVIDDLDFRKSFAHG